MDDDYKKWYIQITNISYQAIQTINNMVLPSNPAIIFDIDDTLIDSTDNIIYPILNIYKFAKVLNLTIIIVTNRSGDEDSIEFTLDQLKKHNITDYKSIYFRSPERENNPWRFKEISRKNIFDRGFNVIMSIGDQQWDIGNYGGVGIVLPLSKLI